MTSPQTTPDLNIVGSESPATPERSTARPSVEPAKAPDPSEQIQRRKGVPVWVVLVVALVGAALFGHQYQRAEQLTAQVGALETELAVLDQKLVAYQTHLDIVRTGVGDLSERVGSLSVLVNSDPLAPAAAGDELGEVTASEVTSPSSAPDDASTWSAVPPPTGHEVIAPRLSTAILPDLSTSGGSATGFP